MFTINTTAKNKEDLTIPSGFVCFFRPNFDFRQVLDVPYIFKFFKDETTANLDFNDEIIVRRPTNQNEMYTHDVKSYTMEEYNSLSNAQAVLDVKELLELEFGVGNVVWS